MAGGGRGDDFEYRRIPDVEALERQGIIEWLSVRAR